MSGPVGPDEVREGNSQGEGLEGNLLGLPDSGQGSRRRFKKGVQKALFRVQCAMRTVCMNSGVDSAMVGSFFGLVFGLIFWTLSGSESAQGMSSGRRS